MEKALGKLLKGYKRREDYNINKKAILRVRIAIKLLIFKYFYCSGENSLLGA